MLTCNPPDSSNLSLSDISEWLRSLPCHKADLVPCGSKILDDMVIQAIEAAVNIMKKSAAIDRVRAHITNLYSSLFN